MIQILDIKSNNFEKNLQFLEFFVLLYVSGHFKQKKDFSPPNANKQGEFMIFEY